MGIFPRFGADASGGRIFSKKKQGRAFPL